MLGVWHWFLAWIIDTLVKKQILEPGTFFRRPSLLSAAAVARLLLALYH